MLDGGNILRVAATISAAVASGTIAGFIISRRISKNKQEPDKWIRVGTVKKLILYPVKSCKGVEVDEAKTTQIGLKGSNYLRDRVFMIVNSSSTCQTQRQMPHMTLIHTALNGNQLTLNAPNMPHITIDIPENVPELRRKCRIFYDHVAEVLDCGDDMAEWLSKYLETPGLRLYYHFLNKTQRSLAAIELKLPTFVPQDKGSFQDQTAFMLMTEESVDYLNTRLEKPVSHKNFRPNIMIGDVPEPFSEDFWTYVRIGGSDGPILKTATPCTRCKLTTVDPEIGEFDENNEPLSTLKKMRKERKVGDNVLDKLLKNEGILGIQMGLYRGNGASVKVGDPVYAAVL